MSRAATAAVVKVMSRENLKRVIAGEAKEFLPAVIIDVREPDEVAMGMIPTAVSLPLQTVPGILSLDPENLAQALQIDSGEDFEPDDTHFIFYCRSGARSGAVRCGELWVVRALAFVREGVTAADRVSELLERGATSECV